MSFYNNYEKNGTQTGNSRGGAKFEQPRPEMPCSYLNFAEENLHKTWQNQLSFFSYL